MSQLLKVIAFIALFLILASVTLSAVTAEPKQALSQCYKASQNKLEEVMKNYNPNASNGRQICNDAFNEANTMRQCVNNVYAKYGQTQTALARRSVNMNNANPVDDAIAKHNQSCQAYPETTIK